MESLSFSSVSPKQAQEAAPSARPSSLYKTPKQALLVVIKAGVAKGLLLWWQVLSLSWHAGMFIGFGAGLVIIVNGGLEAAKITGQSPVFNGSEMSVGEIEMVMTVPSGVKKLIAGALFPIGLILVVLCGAELFTGNVMYLFAARMYNKTTWKNLAHNWILTYFGNLAGSLAVAYFLFHQTELLQVDNVSPSPTQKYLFGIAASKTSLNKWWPYFLKAIGCNYLVCMALWCAACADDVGSKIVALWWPVMCFIAIGFEHSVANMFFVPLAIMEGFDLTPNQFIARNLVPVTLGNVLGGMLFILIQYLIYHPYFDKAVSDQMHLKQGGGDRSSPQTEHSIPGHADSVFRPLYERWVEFWHVAASLPQSELEIQNCQT